MPDAVRAHIDGMKQSCMDVGGKPMAPAKSFLIAADLNGDGQIDWAVDEAGFNCDGAASLFAGSGGSQIYVFVGMPGDQAGQAFVHGAFGMRLEPDTSRGTIWLTVGGELCGQSNPPSRAEAVRCERPLAWNAASGSFEFAPLSVIKPLSGPSSR